jgi:hypothetical protein
MAAAAAVGEDVPFGPGERVAFRITYAHLLAGRATLAVLGPEREDGSGLRFLAEAHSQGFFAWLFRYHVDDRTVASWDPVCGCSLRIEKHLREGRAKRDQEVEFEPTVGIAHVADSKIPQARFDVGTCALDVLSALFVVRIRGVAEGHEPTLSVFDNGRRYGMLVRWRGRERLDLPPPFGDGYPTVIVEPLLVEGSGLFARKGRLWVWLTDDARRVPVRMRSGVAIGSVSADLEEYEPPAVSVRAERVPRPVCCPQLEPRPPGDYFVAGEPSLAR